MRALPAVEHLFAKDFTFDHWPLYDNDPDSPLQCTVNGEWEEFATSELRSFSRSLILLPLGATCVAHLSGQVVSG
jgi:hypothetical protein